MDSGEAADGHRDAYGATLFHVLRDVRINAAGEGRADRTPVRDEGAKDVRILSWFFIVLGVCCTLTVIGAFWGIPMIGVGCLCRLAARPKVF